MNRWRAIATALLVVVILLFVAAPAHAQTFEQLPAIAATVAAEARGFAEVDKLEGQNYNNPNKSGFERWCTYG